MQFSLCPNLSEFRMNRIISIAIVLMLNFNLILCYTIKVDRKVVENLEHQVYKDEENEIFNLNEELSVQEYIHNMTVLTIANGTFDDDGKGIFDFIKNKISEILDRFRNPNK